MPEEIWVKLVKDLDRFAEQVLSNGDFSERCYGLVQVMINKLDGLRAKLNDKIKTKPAADVRPASGGKS
jgi:hypothetical protein